MKKLVAILMVSVAAVLAAPKTQSLLACLWTDLTGVLTPSDGRQFYIYHNNGVGVGDFEEWYGEPSEGELIVGRKGDYNIARVSAFWWDDLLGANTQASLISSRYEAYLKLDDGQGQGMMVGFRANPQGTMVPTVSLGNSVSITSGASTPVSNEPDGSIYLQENVGLFVREAGVWVRK